MWEDKFPPLSFRVLQKINDPILQLEPMFYSPLLPAPFPLLPLQMHLSSYTVAEEQIARYFSS
jgi:hypothetical protein